MRKVEWLAVRRVDYSLLKEVRRALNQVMRHWRAESNRKGRRRGAQNTIKTGIPPLRTSASSAVGCAQYVASAAALTVGGDIG